MILQNMQAAIVVLTVVWIGVVGVTCWREVLRVKLWTLTRAPETWWGKGGVRSFAT